MTDDQFRGKKNNKCAQGERARQEPHNHLEDDFGAVAHGVAFSYTGKGITTASGAGAAAISAE